MTDEIDLVSVGVPDPESTLGSTIGSMSEITSQDASIRALDNEPLVSPPLSTTDITEERQEQGSEKALEPQQPEEPEDPHTVTLKEYMFAAQRGDLDVLKRLLEAKEVTINETLPDNVTALHWCAINNKLTAMKYLVSKGADVNYRGGDLHATPLHWACRYGLVYIADYLIRECSANTHLQDDQGFNILHLSIHSSNVMMVIYILRTTDLDIDEPDPKGRTSLHWAAYQGDILSVGYLLLVKAAVNLQDETGFTPLHWCLVRQSKGIMVKLINAGADLQMETNDGKSCWDIARDMNCVPQFQQALFECGYKNDFSKKRFLLSSNAAKAITFLSPYFILPLGIYIIAHTQIIIGLFGALLLAAIQGAILTKLVVPVYERSTNPLIKSPFFAGVFSSTSFWTIVTWAGVLLPATFKKRSFESFIFLLSATTTMWTFYKGLRMDPGYIEPDTSAKNIEETIFSLISARKFDATNYCIYTDIRRPLRSKFSRAAGRNVARFDHFCPWLYNDVGVRNHKVFFCFALALSISIWLWSSLALKYFDELDVPDEVEHSCLILGDDLCAGYQASRGMFILLCWITFQQMWLTMLLFVQTYQISRGCTTYEFTRITDSTEADFSSVPTDENNSENNSEDDNDMGAKVPSTMAKLACFPTACLNSRLSKVLGINQFAMISNNVIKNRRNGTAQQTYEYDYGVRKNWLNFLFLKRDGESYSVGNLLRIGRGGEANLGDELVDYYKLYEAPVNPRYSSV